MLLDNSGTVLSINPAAQLVAGTTVLCGQTSWRWTGTAVSRALRERHGEAAAPRRAHARDGREYQFDMTRIEADGETVGAVLLAFDVTEQELRRAQPPGVHRQRLPRAENAPAGHHRQRRAARKRHGAAGGCAPLRRAHPQRGPAAGDADRRHHPPVPAGRGGALPRETVELLALCRTAAGAADRREAPVTSPSPARTARSRRAPAARRRCLQPLRQRHQVQRPRRQRRIRESAQGRLPASPWRTPASASRRSTRAGCSSGSTGWTRATPRPPAARDWACPSSSTPCRITTAPWSWTAGRGRSPPSPSRCPLNQ